MSEFSEYIVYVDESGDHGLVSIDPEFPVFALSFCLLKKEDYIDTIVPAFQRFKFEIWGHDAVVLHENDIRKSKEDFAFLLTDPDLRRCFFDELNKLIETTPMAIFASVIDKEKHRARYPNPWNPYQIGLLFCMERLLNWLMENEQEGKTVHIVFESRGKAEDKELQDEFHRICENRQNWGWRSLDFRLINFKPVFVKKAANATGLQLADLTARPIALRQLRPDQSNRAADIIWPKIGDLKCFP